MVKSLGIALTLLILLGTLAAPVASGNPPLACYKAQKDESGGTGNFSNSTCTTEVPALKGEYVLAEPLSLVKETLWCAKITQTPATENDKTGIYETSSCSKKQVNGEFTEVFVPEAQGTTLPDVSVTLTGGHYPLSIEGRTTTATSIGTASGIFVSGKNTALSLTMSELSSLGTFSMTLSNVEEPANKEKCKTGSEAGGTVKFTGEFHVVPLKSSGIVGTLLLISAFELTCGTLKIKVHGDLLGSLNVGSESSELARAGTVVEGSLGVQKLSEYVNDAGSIVRANLETDGGLEYIKADLNVTGEIPLEVLGSQMLVITRR